jgi:toxin ParE1/3/4
MRELVISERAEADLREIWHYSFDNWGETQADRYVDELDAGMRKCGAGPEGGKQQEAVRSGHWSSLVRKHVVFYTFGDDEMLIQRVLHGNVDPTRHV